MTVEKSVLSRIKKLLALARDPSNAHEAAVAASRAQDLLLKHKLSLLEVEQLTELKSAFAEHDLMGEGRSRWSRVLMGGVCRATGCRAFKHGAGLRIIGAAEDIEIVTYLYVYLTRTLTRLCDEGWTRLAARHTHPTLGLAAQLKKPGAQKQWKTSFLMAATQVVCDRLDAQRAKIREAAEREAQAKATTGTALMRLDTQLQRLDEYIEQAHGDHVEQEQPFTYDGNLSGLLEGERAGRSVPLNPALTTQAGEDRKKLR